MRLGIIISVIIGITNIGLIIFILMPKKIIKLIKYVMKNENK